ncbi:adenosine deaminase [Actinoalloteichus hoggarensis]|uniref:Aminodeoxyfutalosine deaminase n=1 Tax=Actinoalloteichus hoggarensis TaxID=1470176 RepID=A0A221VZT1_9PSEU|nr:adenosine deaminase [Actinoalloteichus hoggarensis]ASO18811.1 Aminodeoxyfutalosine deaminase [Actinoalloteichus hoggarensis]MBB5920044.1 adenosine deaminase [Actinoalloteichus hoggarensis]
MRDPHDKPGSGAADRLTALPKAHLHVHLESTVRPDTLREFGAADGVAVPAAAVRSCGAAFAGFREFADRNALVRDCLRRPADFRRIAVEFCADEAAAGTRYVEVTFTAASHGERLGDLGMPLAAVLDGLAEGRQSYGVECRVLLDHSRRRSVERARHTLELAVRHASAGVIGIGMAGDETYSLTPFVSIVDAAVEAGLHVVHHAGECCGAASIREAIDPGRTERLGHGFRVAEDADLLAEVRDRGLPLEVCPSSNVTLGLVDSLAAHPLPLLRDAGLVVTLNTDIPDVTGADLAGEYRRVRDTFDYDDATMAEFARAGVDASFAPAATKARLHREIDAWQAVPAS